MGWSLVAQCSPVTWMYWSAGGRGERRGRGRDGKGGEGEEGGEEGEMKKWQHGRKEGIKGSKMETTANSTDLYIHNILRWHFEKGREGKRLGIHN